MTLLYSTFAATPNYTKGRLYHERESSYKDAFLIDYEKIIRSNSFRRLQYKTQVLINHAGDHFRNRMTHSIEVASIASIISKNLNISSKLAENISLCHDIGHPPFGHTGEKALNQCIQSYGGFCHNAHAIKILTEIDCSPGNAKGLNLTWETLEGVAKHNGPLSGNINNVIANYNSFHNLHLNKYPSLEAQVSAISDDITYYCHDIEDGIQVGYFTIDEILDVPIIAKAYSLINHSKDTLPCSSKNTVTLLTQYLADILLSDVLENTKHNLMHNKIETQEDIANAKSILATFSNELKNDIILLRKFLFQHFYHNHKRYVTVYKCTKIINSLFELYMNDPKCMPLNWQARITGNKHNNINKDVSHDALESVVCDYIACMTDRYAIKAFNAFCKVEF